MHKTIKKVTEDIEAFHFNTSISSIMELVNAVTSSEFRVPSKTIKEILNNIAILMAPFAPHFSEEVWEVLGNKPSIFETQWPKFDESLIKEENVSIVIQVNGKLRDKILVPSSASEDSVKDLVLKSEKVAKWIEGGNVKKIVFLPDKLMNIVT